MNSHLPISRRPDRTVRLYNLLLWLYPPQFRHTYGAEMRLLFRDCLRDARNVGEDEVLTLWLSTFIDVCLSAPRAHLEEWTTMQASYTRASRGGAISAIIATLLLILTFTIGDMFAAFGDLGATLTVLLLLIATFGALVGLYIRVTAIHTSRLTLLGGLVSVIGLLTGLAGSGGWLLNPTNDWSWGATMIGLGLLMLAFAIIGMSASRLSELGTLRFAPLLPGLFTIVVILLLFFYSPLLESGEMAGVLLESLAVVGVAGTALLLWTKAQ